MKKEKKSMHQNKNVNKKKQKKGYDRAKARMEIVKSILEKQD